MKKNVLVFGLISGFIVTAMMVITSISCYNNENFEGNEILGYTTMLIAFSFIFVAIKNYRDKYNNGIISFGKAFKIGLFVTLIAGTIYLLTWLVEYYFFIPDFMDRYCTHVINQAKAKGPDELATTTERMNSMKELYKNPLFVILFTYLEIVPIGLLVTIICALILKRRRRPDIAD